LKYLKIALLFVIILLAFYLFSFAGQGKGEDVVTIEQVKSKITEKDSIVLVDVRTLPEFDGSLGHIPGAILVPLAELESRMTELEGFKDTEMIVICRSGNRSSQATRILRENGFNAYNMQGGMLAWNKMLETAKSDSTGEIDERTSN
jgi:rhodanese-related sulfurtransferase